MLQYIKCLWQEGKLGFNVAVYIINVAYSSLDDYNKLVFVS